MIVQVWGEGASWERLKKGNFAYAKAFQESFDSNKTLPTSITARLRENWCWKAAPFAAGLAFLVRCPRAPFHEETAPLAHAQFPFLRRPLTEDFRAARFRRFCYLGERRFDGAGNGRRRAREKVIVSYLRERL